MSDESANSFPDRSDNGRASLTELLDRLNRFDGPPEQFLAKLLATQCRLAAADAGAILRANPEGQVGVISAWPALLSGSPTPPWLAQAAELAVACLSEGKSKISPFRNAEELYDQPLRQCLAIIPLRGTGDSIRGVAAFCLPAKAFQEMEVQKDRLELSASLLNLYEMRLTLHRRQFDLSRMRIAMETLSAVNEHDRFAGAAMAMCNETASRFRSDRVSLGFLCGRYVKLKATSHAEKFSRKMQLVQDIESAMEECLDQDLEIQYPSGPSSTYLGRATAQLSAHHGPLAICSLPLRHDGQPRAVITLERPADRPFSAEEVESLRLTCDLCAPRLVNLQEHDRWFGARWAGGTRKVLAAAVGPKHTWLKLVAIFALVFVLFLAFVRGDYEVEAPFVLLATRHRVVQAPFDGDLEGIRVRAADSVKAGETLAELKTTELKLQLLSTQAEQNAALKRAAVAWKEDRRGEAIIAESEADKAAAQVRLLEYRIEQARISSPLSGTVVVGDLDRRTRTPVKAGETLFEVADLNSLEADLAVPEDRIADVRIGQEGELATTGDPAGRIRFLTERINPVAEVVGNRNVFKVRVRLLDGRIESASASLRPGMEGVARIRIDRRPYGVLWTRSLLNWLRMKLWW